MDMNTQKKEKQDRKSINVSSHAKSKKTKI